MAMTLSAVTPVIVPRHGKDRDLARKLPGGRLAGADVLPWWAALGVYVFLDPGEAPAQDLTEVAGVGGAWWASGIPSEFPAGTFDHSGLQVTYCFLDDDPAETGERLRPTLEKRWARTGVEPLFAAPFHTIVRYEWGRYLP